MTKRVSILCFGNSLTAGYYQFGLDYHPYAWKLESRLKAAFPSHTFLVNAEGLPGDLAIGPPGRFLPRIQEKCMYVQLVYRSTVLSTYTLPLYNSTPLLLYYDNDPHLFVALLT